MTLLVFNKTTTARLLRRYVALELGGKIGLMLGVALISQWPSISHQPLVVMASELLGYYGLVFLSGLRQRRSFGVGLAHALAEFGLAELLDIILLRSLCLALAMDLLGVPAGAWVGSLLADSVFYGVATLVRRFADR